MKKVLTTAALLLSVSGFSYAEEVSKEETAKAEVSPAPSSTPQPSVATPIEARTFFEFDVGIASLNSTLAQQGGYVDNGYSVGGSVGIILGHLRGGIGAIGLLPSDQDPENLIDDEYYVVTNPDIAFVGYNAFVGGRYMLLDKYEFNLDAGLTSTTDFQLGIDTDAQEQSLETSGGLFIRPSFNYYVTSFIGVRASYFQLIGSNTTAKSMLSVGAVIKL